MHRPLRAAPVLAAGVALALLSLGGSAARAAFPGTSNGLVAYTCGSNVCVVNPAVSGSTGRTLITGASGPVWSPDGTQLAYVTSSGALDVVRVSNGALSGSALQVVVSHASQPTWSPLGTLIAYVNTTDNAIYFAQADGGGTTGPKIGGTVSDPAWSNQGDLAYVREASGHKEIFVTPFGFDDTADDSETQLTGTGGALAGDREAPNWSPDSQFIAYTSTQLGGQPLLYYMDSDGDNQTRIGSGIEASAPAFSPDQDLIVYAVPTGSSGAGQLRTTTDDGDVTTIETGSTGDDPDWQPLFVSGGSGTGAPVNSSYPRIVLSFGSNGAPQVGAFVSATAGTWSGSSGITFTFQWKKCVADDPLNGSCYEIPGATSTLLAVTPDLLGWRLRVSVTATNSDGTTSQNSESSAVVYADPPHLTATPPVFGNNVVGQTLSASTGTWSGSQPITYAYQWKRCDPDGTLPSCVPIAGATTNSYVPTTDDIGAALRLYVTGTNVVGSETDFTNHTFPIVDQPHYPPSSLNEPSIAGATVVGRQLSASSGTFDGDTPIDTSLLWQRCDATGFSCKDITTATKVVYFPTAADIGATLRVAVTATNTYGKTVAYSEPTEPIMAPQPHHKGRRLVGTKRADYLAGSGWDDMISGGAGNDTLLGGNGDDVISGGAGNDIIDGGAGADKLTAGPGSDTIYAQDGERDVVDCGTGRDRAVVDELDEVRNCEDVVSGSPSSGGSGSGSGSGGGTIPGGGSGGGGATAPGAGPGGGLPGINPGA